MGRWSTSFNTLQRVFLQVRIGRSKVMNYSDVDILSDTWSYVRMVTVQLSPHPSWQSFVNELVQLVLVVSAVRRRRRQAMDRLLSSSVVGSFFLVPFTLYHVVSRFQ